jgi:hypothetical protein
MAIKVVNNPAWMTQEYLKRRVQYDPLSGKFTWLPNPAFRPCWNGKHAGNEAGSIDSQGYVVVRIGKVLFKAHRLAWLYMTGEWPKQEIDHKNLVRDDNRICNLRDSTYSQNAANKLAPQGEMRGVHYMKRNGKWRARIKVKGKCIHLGVFLSAADASEAYRRSAEQHFGEYVRI